MGSSFCATVKLQEAWLVGKVAGGKIGNVADVKCKDVSFGCNFWCGLKELCEKERELPREGKLFVYVPSMLCK